MYSLNRAQLIGHLTQDPEIRQTPNGQTVGDLNLLTRQAFTRSDGVEQTTSSFHNVVVWRGLADISARFLKKGSQVYIAGRLQTDEWADQQTGQKRYKTRVVADEMILLDPKMANAPLPAGSKVAGALNQAEVIGNVTRDPELRQTPNGDKVVSFGLATNYSWKDRAGQEQEKTEFHNIVAWGPLAQSIQDAFKKGRKVYIAGRLQTRSWETPDGQKRYTTEIIADRALALGVHDSEMGAPMAGASSTMNVQINTPQHAGIIPPNPIDIPAIQYESEIRPEDLPF